MSHLLQKREGSKKVLRHCIYTLEEEKRRGVFRRVVRSGRGKVHSRNRRGVVRCGGPGASAIVEWMLWSSGVGMFERLSSASVVVPWGRRSRRRVRVVSADNSAASRTFVSELSESACVVFKWPKQATGIAVERTPNHQVTVIPLEVVDLGNRTRCTVILCRFQFWCIVLVDPEAGYLVFLTRSRRIWPIYLWLSGRVCSLFLYQLRCRGLYSTEEFEH